MSLVQEKHGKQVPSRLAADQKAKTKTSSDSDESTDSEDEDEDEDGVFASGTVDVQIQDTLQAIRNKDPRIYDSSTAFFTNDDADEMSNLAQQPENATPVSLPEYHRRNLLGHDADHIEDVFHPRTYVKQQRYLRDNVVREIHNAGLEDGDGVQDDLGEDAFLVARKSAKGDVEKDRPIRKDALIELNLQGAEENPDDYLTRFMSTRAWVPTERSTFQAFHSDDEEDDQRAEQFEEAYNMRFEDPSKTNDKLTSHARDIVAKHSVRKEKLNTRRKARDLERERKEAMKQVRMEEKARLRKLRIGELEEKLQKIKQAAGFRNEKLDDEDWSIFLEDGWDDETWEKEMQARFGEAYYAETEVAGEVKPSGKTKLTKPKWTEDVDIDDIIPDFDAGATNIEAESDDLADSSKKRGVSLGSEKVPRRHKDIKHQRELDKREQRKDRRKIERLVDEQMGVDEVLTNFGRKHTGHFRYRDTSPLAFGLTAQDILMASDNQLNQYAGLKKMAAFRDPDKKRKDAKSLGRKARLRQWRKETFGNEAGPRQTFEDLLKSQPFGPSDLDSKGNGSGGVDIREGRIWKRKKKAAR